MAVVWKVSCQPEKADSEVFSDCSFERGPTLVGVVHINGTDKRSLKIMEKVYINKEIFPQGKKSPYLYRKDKDIERDTCIPLYI